VTEFSLSPTSDFDRFVLNKERVGMRLPLDSYVVQTMRFSQEALEHTLDEMVFRLEAFVLQDKLPPKTVEETLEITLPTAPDTWWDLFKAVKLNENKWYWRWLEKLKTPKFSVRTHEVTMQVDIERWVSYPEAQNVPDTFGNRYHGYNMKSNIWSS
jgi:hypothetical protein